MRVTNVAALPAMAARRPSLASTCPNCMITRPSSAADPEGRSSAARSEARAASKSPSIVWTVDCCTSTRRAAWFSPCSRASVSACPKPSSASPYSPSSQQATASCVSTLHCAPKSFCAV